MARSPYPTDNPLDGRGAGAPISQEPAIVAELAQALAGVADMRRRGVILADALRACITRLSDLGDGDNPPAENARAALLRAGL